MATPSFTFASETETTGFDAYRDLYAAGSDVAATGAPFHARVDGHRFEQLLLFERHLAGVAHSRNPARVRRDDFDHFTLQLLCDGTFRGGPIGSELALAQGDIILFDMTQPQRTLAEGAHFLTVALPRDVVEAAAPHAGKFHGTILPRANTGLLGDLLRSLARRGDTVPANSAVHVSRAVAEFLAIAISTDVPEAAVPPARLTAMRLERAQAFIDARLGDSRLDAATIASGIAVSRSVLYRLFAPAGGVAQYILNKRLEQMRAALRHATESRSISTLAYDCGFSSESHCSRAFRTAYGLPPGRYRAEAGGGRIASTNDPAVGARALMADWVSKLY